jgi:hypothetical protein
VARRERANAILPAATDPADTVLLAVGSRVLVDFDSHSPRSQTGPDEAEDRRIKLRATGQPPLNSARLDPATPPSNPNPSPQHAGGDPDLTRAALRCSTSELPAPLQVLSRSAPEHVDLAASGETARANGVGSPVDPYRLGDTMDTRTIAIAALVLVIIIAVVLFVL